MKAKATTQPKTLGECSVDDLVHTPAGHLRVTGEVNGWKLCRLWHSLENRDVSQPFCVRPSLQVLKVERRQSAAHAVQQGAEFDPLRG